MCPCTWPQIPGHDVSMCGPSSMELTALHVDRAAGVCTCHELWVCHEPCAAEVALELLPSAFCLLPAACCLLPAACCLLPAACCLLPAALTGHVHQHQYPWRFPGSTWPVSAVSLEVTPSTTFVRQQGQVQRAARTCSFMSGGCKSCVHPPCAVLGDISTSRHIATAI
jgi:hypothetical protein